MAKLYHVMQNDPAISKIIWPAFKPTLEEKHGTAGATGARGEDNAAILLQNEEHFPEINLIIKHEDALHQLMGVDFTTVGSNGRVNYIDVKAGSSALYWNKDNTEWYITFNPEWYSNPNKKTDYFMHLGPKGDLFAIYRLNDMLEWLIDNHKLLIDGKYGKILYRNHWPKDLIHTNLW